MHWHHDTKKTGWRKNRERISLEKEKNGEVGVRASEREEQVWTRVSGAQVRRVTTDKLMTLTKT